MATTIQAPPTEALARKPMSLMEMLKASIPQIEMALPRHLTAERMIRVAVTAIQKTPALQECSPRSIVGAVIQASQLGLEPDGVLGQAYLVPFYNDNTRQKEAQLQIGYRGFITLARRSGEVSSVYAELVFACDKFKVSYGTDKKLTHEPDMDQPERGATDENGDLVGLRGAYAVVKYKDGSDDFEYMSKHELDRIRASSKAKSSKSPWQTHPAEMYRKCPIRRLAKRLPLSAEFMKAAVMDEYAEAGVVTGASEMLVEDNGANNAAATAGMKAEQELQAKLRKEQEAEAQRKTEAERMEREQKVRAWHKQLVESGACAAGTDELGYCKLPKGHEGGHQMVPPLTSLEPAPAAEQETQQQPQEAQLEPELASPAIEFGNNAQEATEAREERPRSRRRY